MVEEEKLNTKKFSPDLPFTLSITSFVSSFSLNLINSALYLSIQLGHPTARSLFIVLFTLSNAP
jgi:hypothetical protein